ncbi:(p)ppGpp synthetase [Spirochaetia bacterium]|nr:(p)ppGpp synthetase [Spirochaetia bacterium]
MNPVLLPDQNILKKEYEKYSKVRALVTRDLEALVEKMLAHLGSRPTVKGRSKDFASFFRKYVRILKGKNIPAEDAPVENNCAQEEKVVITDLIGIRIVCPFLENLDMVEKLIKENFEVIEVEKKGSNYSFKEFGYESTHFLIKIPADIVKRRGHSGADVAEIQVRTILQDAWAEVEHELVYKAEFNPFDEPMKRKLAAVNASLSLADIVFQEVRDYQRQLNGELGKRRESFFQKIEESTDALLFDNAELKPREAADNPLPPSSGSVDDLLLNALYAHNKNQFAEAITFYSRILEMEIEDTIRSLIYKHRGMAYFAQSKYQEAIDDFSDSLKWDEKAYKAAYYRGVVWAVMQRYNEAAGDFSLSLEINPYQAFCLFRRSQAYYHIGDYPQALGDCEASLALEPGNEIARRLRDLLHDKLKM